MKDNDVIVVIQSPSEFNYLVCQQIIFDLCGPASVLCAAQMHVLHNSSESEVTALSLRAGEHGWGPWSVIVNHLRSRFGFGWRVVLARRFPTRRHPHIPPPCWHLKSRVHLMWSPVTSPPCRSDLAPLEVSCPSDVSTPMELWCCRPLSSCHLLVQMLWLCKGKAQQLGHRWCLQHMLCFLCTLKWLRQ